MTYDGPHLTISVSLVVRRLYTAPWNTPVTAMVVVRTYKLCRFRPPGRMLGEPRAGAAAAAAAAASRAFVAQARAETVYEKTSYTASGYTMVPTVLPQRV